MKIFNLETMKLLKVDLPFDEIDLKDSFELLAMLDT
jgi:hypothetical protein